MHISKHLAYAAAAFLLASLVACATTPTLTGSWRDDTYTGKFEKVLVVGISANQAARRLFEDTVANGLKARGIEASALSRVAPGDAIPDKTTIEAMIREKSFASVITTRVIGKEKDTHYVPGSYNMPPRHYYHRMNNYVDTVYPVVYSPGYLVDDTIVSLESNGYDTAAGKLVWSITTELFNPNNLDKEVGQLSDLIIKQLEQNGLIP